MMSLLYTQTLVVYDEFFDNAKNIVENFERDIQQQNWILAELGNTLIS